MELNGKQQKDCPVAQCIATIKTFHRQTHWWLVISNICKCQFASCFSFTHKQTRLLCWSGSGSLRNGGAAELPCWDTRSKIFYPKMSGPLKSTRNTERKLTIRFYGSTVAREAERLKLFTPPLSHHSRAAVAAASAAVSWVFWMTFVIVDIRELSYHHNKKVKRMGSVKSTPATRCNSAWAGEVCHPFVSHFVF